MKKVSLFFLLAIAAGFIFVVQSCKKENQAPVLTLDEPADGESIAITDSLHIEGEATDDKELHEMSILILSHMGDTVYSEYPAVHGLGSYTFHRHYHPTDTGMFHLHIMVSDHDDATAEKQLMFTVTQ